MKIENKSVSIYIDLDQNVIIIPHGLSSQRDIKEINIVYELKYPYTDEQLEEKLVKAMEASFSIVPEDSDISVIEQYLGIQGYSKAMKGKKCIIFTWLKDTGFSIISTKKISGGFLYGQNINLGKEIQKGALAIAFKKALELSR